MQYAAVVLVSYLIGAIPFAYLVTRVLTGRDIRKLGSGNVGVMNTIRQAGLPAGMLVFVGEGGKGIAALEIGHLLTGRVEGALAGALAALIGVNWSIFVGFAGGRGTTLCVFVVAVVAPWVLLAGAALWLAVYGLRRDNFIATRVNIVGVPLLTLAITHSWTYFGFAAAACVVLLLKHNRATDDHFQLAHEPVQPH